MSASPAGRARSVVAAAVAAALAALGALILGEYELTGAVAAVAGPLFGVAVAETAVWVAGGRHPGLGVLAAVVSALGVLWGGWIASSEGLRPFPATAWLAAALGAGFAAALAGRRPRGVTG